MDKDEAKKRLSSIEVEVKELRKIIEAPDKPKPITERVKTFEDALAIVGASDNVKILLDYNGVDEDMLSHQAHAKLTIIARALNEGWIPDWNNSNQYKYYNWFDMRSKSGFGFSRAGSYYDYAGTDVGSRLCFKSSALAEYAGKTFVKIYKDYLV